MSLADGTSTVRSCAEKKPPHGPGVSQMAPSFFDMVLSLVRVPLRGWGIPVMVLVCQGFGLSCSKPVHGIPHVRTFPHSHSMWSFTAFDIRLESAVPQVGFSVPALPPGHHRPAGRAPLTPSVCRYGESVRYWLTRIFDAIPELMVPSIMCILHGGPLLSIRRGSSESTVASGNIPTQSSVPVRETLADNRVTEGLEASVAEIRLVDVTNCDRQSASSDVHLIAEEPREGYGDLERWRPGSPTYGSTPGEVEEEQPDVGQQSYSENVDQITALLTSVFALEGELRDSDGKIRPYLRADPRKKPEDCEEARRLLPEQQRQVRSAKKDLDRFVERIIGVIAKWQSLLGRHSSTVFTTAGWLYTTPRIRKLDHGQDTEPLTEFDYSRASRPYLYYGPPSTDPKKVPSRNQVKIDHLFDGSYTNKLIFEALKAKIEVVTHRYDVLIMADGASGTGKSYTMFEGPDALGSSAAALVTGWRGQDLPSGWTREVKLSALEFTKKGSRDLLSTSSDAGGKKIKACQVVSANDTANLIRGASKKRTVGPTANNHQSSRGHFICTLTLTETQVGTRSVMSRVCLVDLAGSETAGDSGDDEETRWINRSRSHIRTALVAMRESRLWGRGDEVGSCFPSKSTQDPNQGAVYEVSAIPNRPETQRPLHPPCERAEQESR